jgi:hypothetical protein
MASSMIAEITWKKGTTKMSLLHLVNATKPNLDNYKGLDNGQMTFSVNSV